MKKYWTDDYKLPNPALNLLNYFGIESIDQLRSGLLSGKLRPKCIKGYGKVYHAIFCKIAGVEMPPSKPKHKWIAVCPHCGKYVADV